MAPNTLNYFTVIFFVLIFPQSFRAEERPVLSIEQVKQLAQGNNASIQLAKENLYQTELLIDKAWSALKPQWNAYGSYTHHDNALSLSYPNIAFGFEQSVCGDRWSSEFQFCILQGDPPTNDLVFQKHDSFGFHTTITQPLFAAQIFSTIKNTYLAFDIAQLNTANAKDYVLYSVEIAYYGALASLKLVEIARHSLQLRSEHLESARTKFEAGEVAKISVIRAEIDVNQAEQDLKRSENSFELSKEVLKRLIGFDQDFSLVEPAAPKLKSASIENTISLALANRLDMQAAKLNLDMADALKTKAWYKFLPSLHLTGVYGVNDYKGFSDSYTYFNIGLTLSIPLYDGGLRYAEIKEARSKIRAAQIQIKDKKNAIASEIRQLWLKKEMAEANLIKSEQAVEIAKEQLELAKASFETGGNTNLELLDANHMLTLSRINLAQEELNLQMAIIKINNAIKIFSPR
jgi:outer membrane protein TolC